MKNILHIILIAFFSLTIISCSSDDSKTTDNTCTSSDVSFLAVGASGTLLTSADGTCWTAQTSGTTNNLRAFAIKPSTIGVVVGFSGTILTTTDGTTWTSRTSGTSNDLNNVHYSSGSSGFVAVGDSGTLLTSSDGITWTDKTSSCGMTENLWSVSSNSTVAVAVGDNGSIYTSADAGDNCTKRTSGTTVEFNELLFGNSTFFALGNLGTILTSSDNGTSWDNRTSGTTNHLYGGIYSEKNAMVGASGTVVYTEDNGTSWTSWSASSMTTDVFGIAYGSSTWVFVGRSGTIYTAGNDDDDVTARTSGTTESLRRVYYLGE